MNDFMVNTLIVTILLGYGDDIMGYMDDIMGSMFDIMGHEIRVFFNLISALNIVKIIQTFRNYHRYVSIT